MWSVLHGNYCLAVSIPESWQARADFTLAGLLTAGAAVFTEATFWPVTAIEWMSMLGGFIGVCIAAVRLYKMIFSNTLDTKKE